MKNRFLFLFLIFCCAQLYWGVILYGQNCGPCTVTITANNQSVPNNQNSSAVICFQGNFNYSANFDLNGSTVCIDEGVTLTRNGGNWNGNWTINNYGTFNANSINFNSNNTINNFNTLNFPGSASINGTLLSVGTLNIGGSATFNSGSKITVVGTTTIGGAVSNNSSITLGGSLSVAGSFQNNSNGTIQAINGNQCNSVSVLGSFSSNGIITGNNYDYAGTGSALYVNKTPGGNANPKLSGGATVGSCPSIDCVEINEIITSTQRSITYIFRCSGDFTSRDLLVDEDSLIASTLIVAGGGGGGFGDYAGGGGAGGFIEKNDISLIPNNTYHVIVGTGGIGASIISIAGQNGTNSSFFGYTAIGGGGGASDNYIKGSTGGSGGGAAGDNGSAGSGISNQGESGGIGTQNGINAKGGGGGGASSAGHTADNGNKPGGNGGEGKQSLIINGNSQLYAAGGGGTGRGGGGSGGSSSTGGDGIKGGIGKNGIQNTGSGGGAGSLRGGSGSNGIVVISIVYIIQPVDYLYFNATYLKEDKSGILDWSTAKEWENSHFEIERAVNSVKEWETIGRVEGKGYSENPEAYTFTDNNLPITGGNIFYRLKQVDFSGKYSYSRTRAIQAEATQSNSTWTAYPNPSLTGSDVSVQLTQLQNYHDQSIYIRLVNMLGDGESMTLNSPEEVSQVVSEWIRNKNAGIYILDIRWGANSQQIKLLRN